MIVPSLTSLPPTLPSPSHPTLALDPRCPLPTPHHPAPPMTSREDNAAPGWPQQPVLVLQATCLTAFCMSRLLRHLLHHAVPDSWTLTFLPGYGLPEGSTGLCPALLRHTTGLQTFKAWPPTTPASCSSSVSLPSCLHVSPSAHSTAPPPWAPHLTSLCPLHLPLHSIGPCHREQHLSNHTAGLTANTKGSQAHRQQVCYTGDLGQLGVGENPEPKSEENSLSSNKRGLGETAPWVKCLPLECEDLSLILRSSV